MKEEISYGATTQALLHGSHTPLSHQALDAAIAQLQKNKDRWAQQVTLQTRINMLQRLFNNVCALQEEWVHADLQIRQRKITDWDAATSYIGSGPGIVLRLLSHYIRVLTDIKKDGRPQGFGALHKNACDQLVIKVFPQNFYDKLIFRNIVGEIILASGISEKEAVNNLARPYQEAHYPGKVALVLGAGNYGSITIIDTLYKLINEKQVVLIKLHPITEPLGDIFNKLFKEFIECGLVSICYGGIPEGEYLCRHPGIDEIHVTGSDKTFEKIIENVNTAQKRVTAELGNVSPVIVVPGPWTQKEIAHQANNIAASLVYNSGFSCNASRVIIQQKNWQLRDTLNDQIKQVLQDIPTSAAYYPGAIKKIKEALQHYPDAFCVGNIDKGEMPWIYQTDVDSNNNNEHCFKCEIFGGFLAETALDNASVIDFIDSAVTFCNQTLWGSLNAMIVVHPQSMRDPQIKSAVERALKDLKYGTVAINVWPAMSYYFGYGQWGGYPSTSIADIQSGNGRVQNPFMFEDIEKNILRAPFYRRSALFPTHKKFAHLAKKMLELEAHRNVSSFFKLLLSFIK